MGHRELRPVPLDWEHPRDADGHYVPLFSRADLRRDIAEMDATCDAIDRGEIDFNDAELEPVFEQDYMPEIPEGTPLGWQLYETTTEGTPSSPVFATLEELAQWCETGATAYADDRWTAEQWLAAFRGDLSAATLPYGSPGRELLSIGEDDRA